MALYTQADVDAFKAFMLKNPGVLELWIGDRHQKFESLKAMREHLAYMERMIDTAPPSTRYGQTSKGV